MRPVISLLAFISFVHHTTPFVDDASLMENWRKRDLVQEPIPCWRKRPASLLGIYTNNSPRFFCIYKRMSNRLSLATGPWCYKTIKTDLKRKRDTQDEDKGLIWGNK